MPSGGTAPISVAVNDHFVYVLNSGTPNNVSGFWLDESGELYPLPASTHALSGPSVAPAQVAFTPSGDALIVTEKGTNLIDVFPLGFFAQPGELHTVASSGKTPFGFAFARDRSLVVSEAFGAAAGLGAVSSYALDRVDSVSAVSRSVADGQTAPCWVAVTGDGRWALTTNAHSGTISAYEVAVDGALTLGPTTATGDSSTPLDSGLR